MELSIVDMTPEYYAGKGRVHFVAWHETYDTLMPRAFLDGLSEERCAECAARWSENTLVALDDGNVVGFACYSPHAKRDESGSEIIALYVLRAYQKRGLGKALLMRCFERLPLGKTYLYVLDNNENAIGFYKKSGFDFTGERMIAEKCGESITELEMLLIRD